MSAEPLRRAANAARDEWAGETTGPFKHAARIHLAVADWLEFSTITIDGLDAAGSKTVVAPGAFAVARAYLGEPA